jgi:hypothetical protein
MQGLIFLCYRMERFGLFRLMWLAPNRWNYPTRLERLDFLCEKSVLIIRFLSINSRFITYYFVYFEALVAVL